MMTFEWGDKVCYQDGGKTVEALFLDYVGEKNSRIIIKARGPLGTNQVLTNRLRKQPVTMPPLTFQRGAAVVYDGEVYTFAVEYKQTYIIGREDPKLEKHRAYYHKIHDMYYIKVPKSKVTSIGLTNQNMKYLLEGN